MSTTTERPDLGELIFGALTALRTGAQSAETCERFIRMHVQGLIDQRDYAEAIAKQNNPTALVLSDAECDEIASAVVNSMYGTLVLDFRLQGEEMRRAVRTTYERIAKQKPEGEKA